MELYHPEQFTAIDLERSGLNLYICTSGEHILSNIVNQYISRGQTFVCGYSARSRLSNHAEIVIGKNHGRVVT